METEQIGAPRGWEESLIRPINSKELMYNIVTIGNNTVLCP